MRRVTVALVAALVAGTACHGPEDRFTSRVAERLKQKYPGTKVTVAGTFHLEATTGGGDAKEIHLDNLWGECHTPEADCDAAIDRFLRLSAQDISATEPYVKPETVRAVLKDREWMDQLAATLGKAPADKRADNEIVSRPFVTGLWVVYVFDMPDGMRIVSRKDMQALKLDEPGLQELALANLEAALPAIAFEPAQPGSSVRVVHVGDSYEASRLLLHDRWREVAAQVKGDLLVSAPTRDFVLFTGSREDPAGLRALARRASEQGGHPLSPGLLRFTKDGWEPVP